MSPCRIEHNLVVSISDEHRRVCGRILPQLKLEVSVVGISITPCGGGFYEREAGMLPMIRSSPGSSAKAAGSAACCQCRESVTTRNDVGGGLGRCIVATGAPTLGPKAGVGPNPRASLLLNSIPAGVDFKALIFAGRRRALS